MRASRLLQTVLLLQTRGNISAPRLAEELEVSVRTVYRDLEALSAAGVPVYSEVGRNGGVRLVDGYRTRINGLTTDEADALLLAGVPGPAAELGLGTVLAAAQLKVLAALPPELRSRATRVQQRFHLDAPGWFHREEEVPHLATVAEALWSDRLLRIGYRRNEVTAERVVAPLGLVLKAGTWYVVGAVQGSLRTYRAGRIVSAEVLEEGFERPEDFDLAGHWAASAAEFESAMLGVEARIRVRADAVGELRMALDPVAARAVADATEGAEPDADGWLTVDVPTERFAFLASDLLRLGSRVEVLEPPELREQLLDTARAMVCLYEEGGTNRT